MTESELRLEFVGKLGEVFVERLRNGERPSVKEYVERYPEYRAEIEELFPTLAMMEDLAPAGAFSETCDEPRGAGAARGDVPHSQLGDYRILREIGRGGMGIVYEAEQVSLGRHVALKVLPKELLKNPKHRLRFEREAKAAAKLHHTNVVPVFGVGEEADVCYYVMQFIQGLGLDAVVEELRNMQSQRTQGVAAQPAGGLQVNRRQASAAAVAGSLMTGTFRFRGPEATLNEPAVDADQTVIALESDSATEAPRAADATRTGLLSDTFSLSASSAVSAGSAVRQADAQGKPYTYWQSVAQIGVQVADALHYAHMQGVLHRDIKPSNLLLDLRGTVWVTDFGLAKLDNERELTQTGDILGTLRYMAPETFKGRSDARSELYSLGLTLFELLVFRPAYTQTNRNALIDQVMNAEVEPLGKINPDIPRDLQTIIHKAIDRDPEHRYQSGQELAEDLRRFVRDEPIKARRISSLEKLARWSRHNKGLAASLAAVMILVSVIAISSTLAAGYFQRLSGQLKSTVGSLTSAQKELQTTIGQLETSRNAAAASAAENLRLAQEAESARQGAQVMLADMQTQNGLRAWEGGDAAKAMFWFAQAATQTPHDRARREVNECRAQNAMHEAVLPVAAREFAVSAGCRCLKFQPGGTLLMSLGQQQLLVWNWQLDEPLVWHEPQGAVTDADWSPDGSQFAAATALGVVEILDVSTGERINQLSIGSPAHAVAYSSDGERLVVGCEAGAQIWNVAGEPVLLKSLPHPQAVFSVLLNRDGSRLVTGCRDSHARVFDVTGDSRNDQPLFSPVPHGGHWESSPVLVDGDRRLITLSTTTRSPESRDIETGAILNPEGFDFSVASGTRRLLTSPDRKWIVATTGNSCELWQIGGGHRHLPHANHVDWVAFTATGDTVFTSCWDWHCRGWPLTATSQPPLSIPQLEVAYACALSSDGEFLAVAGVSALRVWKRPQRLVVVGGINTWNSRFTHPRPGFDGRWVAPGTWHESSAGSLDSESITIAEMRTGLPAGPAIQHVGIVDSCLCADNRSVAVVTDAENAGTLVIHDVVTGAVLTGPISLPAPGQSVDARPDRSQVAVLCRNGVVVVYDQMTGQEMYRRLGHDDLFTVHHPRVRYTPDGKSLVALSQDNSVTVFDAETGEPRFAPIQPILQNGPCRALDISADSRWLATGVCGQNAVQVWDLATGQPACAPIPHPGDYYGIFAVRLSPDGRLVLSGNKDGRARVWDWAQESLACPPLQHTDEVLDVEFTADGRHALTAVRNGSARCWELTTGKLVASPFDYPVPPETSTDTLAIAGDYVVAGAKGYPILHLAPLLAKPEVSTDSLLVLSELATGGQLLSGEHTGLSNADWMARWDVLDDREALPASFAETLARELDAATEPARREMIVRRAARSAAVLKELERLRPEVPELQILLLEQAIARGDRSAIAPYRERAISYLEQQLATSPHNMRLVERLASLLLENQSFTWSVLEPSSVVSAGGASLQVLDDQSVLVSGDHVAADIYRIQVRSPLATVAAVRLEVLPDPSLPRSGPGRHVSGNFQLERFRLFYSQANSPEPVAEAAFSDAWASYTWPAPKIHVLGPIRPEMNSVWHVFGRPGEPHEAVFLLDQPLHGAVGSALTIELSHHDIGAAINLGRFRLSVTDDPLVLDRLRPPAGTSGDHTSSWIRLAAAYSLLDRPDRAAAALGVAIDQAPTLDVVVPALTRLPGKETLLAALMASRPQNARVAVVAARSAELAGDTDGSEALLSRARELCEARLASDPLDSEANALLATLLLEATSPPWATLRPATFSSRTGCDFQVDADGRIRTGAADRVPEAYTLTFTPDAPIAILRLETIPDPDLPDGGASWEATGNFHLAEVRALLQHADGTETPISFRAAASDWIRSLDGSTTLDDGPWATIDGEVSTRWDVWHSVRSPHWLALTCDTLVEPQPGDVLRLVLDFDDPAYPLTRLGSFRVSVAADEQALRRLLLSDAVRQQTASGLYLTAAARLAVDDMAGAQESLAAARGDNARSDVMSEILGALLAQSLGEIDEARDCAGRLEVLLQSTEIPQPLHPLACHVLVEIGGMSAREASRLCREPQQDAKLQALNAAVGSAPQDSWVYSARATYLARSGRWDEAAVDSVRAAELLPQERILWLRAAATLVLAGRHEDYRRFCQQRLAAESTTIDPLRAEALCKACLLLPEAVNPDDLPVDVVVQGCESGEFEPYHVWFRGSLALIAYRRGEFQQALEMIATVENSNSQLRALLDCVAAMSLHRLDRHQEAQAAFDQAASLIPLPLATLGIHSVPGNDLVHEDLVSHDWLIPEVLRREAIEVLNE